MARDYKHRAATRKPAKKQPNCWVWLLVGVLLGAFGVGLAWLKLGAGAGGDSGWIGAGPDQGRTPTAVTPDTAAPEQAQPFRFDFYDRLSKEEVVVPDDELVADEPPRTGTATPAPATRYLLQVGSFRKPADADRLKAQLTLLGFDAGVVKVRVDDRHDFYRVRVGPFTGLSSMEKARRRLSENGYKTLVVRLAGKG